MLLLSTLLLLAPADTYLGREIATTMHWLGAEWLIRAEREAEEHVTRLIDLLQLEPGQSVCDLGSGNGALTLPIARRVGPTGTVLAVDIQPQMLELLADRARDEEIEHITTVLGDQEGFPVEPASLDLVLMVDVYHELSRPAPLLAHLSRSLAPEGLVCLAEYRLEDPRVPIKRLHKMSQAQVVRELAQSGFRFVRGSSELPRQHLLFFGAGLFEEASPAQQRERAIRWELSRGLARAWASGEQRLLLPYYAQEVRVLDNGIERRRDREDVLRDALGSRGDSDQNEPRRWTAVPATEGQTGFLLQVEGQNRWLVRWERDEDQALFVTRQELALK